MSANNDELSRDKTATPKSGASDAGSRQRLILSAMRVCVLSCRWMPVHVSVRGGCVPLTRENSFWPDDRVFVTKDACIP